MQGRTSTRSDGVEAHAIEHCGTATSVTLGNTQRLFRQLREPLLNLVFLLVPLRWRFAARAACKHLRKSIDTQAACIIGLLRPSALISRLPNKMTDGRLDAANAAIRPVVLRREEDCVTSICFGQPRVHQPWVVLAVASQAGHASIYHCHHNAADLAYVPDAEQKKPNAPHMNFYHPMTFHVRLVGHLRAITSIKFNSVSEDQVLTASADKTVRFWDVDSGAMLKVFNYSRGVIAAVCLPLNPERFVSADSRRSLFLASTQGLRLQRVKFRRDARIRSLAFDDSGLVLYAGTKDGLIRVFRASDSGLYAQFDINLGPYSVECMTFVGAVRGSSALLFVTTCDSWAQFPGKTIRCIYDPFSSNCVIETIYSRVCDGPSRALPCGFSYSSSGGGNLVSAFEGKDVCIYSLAGAFNRQVQRLTHHDSRVTAVAVNHHDTLLVSGDEFGDIILWRRIHT